MSTARSPAPDSGQRHPRRSGARDAVGEGLDEDRYDEPDPLGLGGCALGDTAGGEGDPEGVAQPVLQSARTAAAVRDLGGEQLMELGIGAVRVDQRLDQIVERAAARSTRMRSIMAPRCPGGDRWRDRGALIAAGIYAAGSRALRTLDRIAYATRASAFAVRRRHWFGRPANRRTARAEIRVQRVSLCVNPRSGASSASHAPALFVTYITKRNGRFTAKRS